MAVTEHSAGRGWRHSDPASSCTANFGGLNGAASSYTAVAGDVMVGIARVVLSNINNVTPPAGSSSLWNRSGIGGAYGLVASAKEAVGGETGLTFTHSETADEMTVAALILKGCLSPMAIDRSANNPSDFSTHTSWPTGTTSTISQPDAGIVSACVPGAAVTSPAVDGTASLVLAIDSNRLLIAFRAVSSMAAYAQTFSWSGPTYAIAGIGVIKAAATPTGRGKLAGVKHPTKYWNGSAWVEKPFKHHNGSAWVALS